MNIKKRLLELKEVPDNPNWERKEEITAQQEIIQRIIKKLRQCDLKIYLEKIKKDTEDLFSQKTKTAKETNELIRKIKEWTMSVDDKVLKHYQRPGMIAAGLTALVALFTIAKAEKAAADCVPQNYLNPNTKQVTTLQNCNGHLFDQNMNPVGIVYPNSGGVQSNQPQNQGLQKLQAQPYQQTPTRPLSDYQRGVLARYNYPSAKMYIDETNKAYGRHDYDKIIKLTEDALDRINNNKLKATPDEKIKIEHRKDIGYELLIKTK